MTKDKKLGRMSTTPAEKRRSFIPGGSSSSNNKEHTSGGGSSSASNSNAAGGPSSSSAKPPTSSSQHGGGGSSNAHHVLHTSNPRTSTANIIAPPPRAHHGPANSSSASPNPEDGVTAATASSSSSKDAKDKDSRHKEASGGGNNSNNSNAAGTAGTTSHGHGGISSSAQVKDKDARIAHLERELEIMEREFTKELDKLSQNESETAVFWQAKHSDVNQQFLRADADLRLLRQESEARDADRDALRREVGELRVQVRGLKEFVSTSTRTSGQTSDEVFCDGMARLSNGLQNWVIVNFRRAKLDFAAASDDVLEELGQLVPMYADLEPSAKVHMLQSVVSRVLVETIFNSYFFGLPKEQAEQLKAVEQTLSGYVDSPEAINNWRSTTLALLQREADSKMQAETLAATDRVIARVNRILDAVTDAVPAPPATGETTNPRDAGLRALVGSAADLARQLAVQKAVFRVHMPDIVPHQQTRFDAATMEDIGGEDEEALSQRDIACVTFPGIIKRGDENGGHMQYQNVIAKARVLCSPE
ncbi:hypothetical protein CABS01_12414 [Colletotrichum abscissum]|uniref:Involucrin repeat protein n=1 Tax=Colletotrichum abscissum TaxID=1671311 RepID=A0A9P9XLD1_9PEZI|nr:uncharacterized protein CABS01_12414 [Colletotrichum abscissum]KAI3555297.1 hypothetical protein CABS02_04397 [Colletotrichum abscissum]KAK1490614.1 hypothetical protein CABS01_12414 [Colletotrichum abscissum]